MWVSRKNTHKKKALLTGADSISQWKGLVKHCFSLPLLLFMLIFYRFGNFTNITCVLEIYMLKSQLTIKLDELELNFMGNSDNTRIGATFQQQVRDWFQQTYGIKFDLEKKIAIGKPAKEHKFDIVDEFRKVAIECKRYTWTETGNVPSAKIGFTNEAAFYLSFLPNTYDKYIVMLYSYHPKRNETLAEYYYRRTNICLGVLRLLSLILKQVNFM